MDLREIHGIPGEGPGVKVSRVIDRRAARRRIQLRIHPRAELSADRARECRRKDIQNRARSAGANPDPAAVILKQRLFHVAGRGELGHEICYSRATTGHRRTRRLRMRSDIRTHGTRRRCIVYT